MCISIAKWFPVPESEWAHLIVLSPDISVLLVCITIWFLHSLDKSCGYCVPQWTFCRKVLRHTHTQNVKYFQQITQTNWLKSRKCTLKNGDERTYTHNLCGDFTCFPLTNMAQPNSARAFRSIQVRNVGLWNAKWSFWISFYWFFAANFIIHHGKCVCMG